MEELIEVLFVLIAIGASVVSSVVKAGKKSKEAVARHQAAAPKPPAPKTEPHPYVPAAVTPADVPVPVITPTVHVHAQPDCDTHDAVGSLNYTSTEGKDPCHAEQLAPRRPYEEPAEETPTPGMTFEWSGENMVKAFVMQEVLARPAQRRR